MKKSEKAPILGIDIGSVSVSAVLMDTSGRVQKDFYLFHHGKIRECLRSLQKSIDLTNIQGIACTAFPGLNSDRVLIYHPQVAAVAATKKLSPKAGSVLLVGAEKFMLIEFDRKGNYKQAHTNSSCAAGTGSFLDQQAGRLNLPGIEELSKLALQNTGEIPDIASRCSVFAKTDLIHAQQKGYPLEAICDSLCKGLAKNIVDTLFCKESPARPILFLGGVSKNKVVIKHLEEQLNTTFLQHPSSHLFGAMGACYLLQKEKAHVTKPVIQSLDEILLSDDIQKEYFHEPLTLNLNSYPDFSSEESSSFTPVISGHTTDVEIEIYVPLIRNQNYTVYFGIDIGSTSTKAMVTDEQKKPLMGFYTYTAGNPITAVKAILEAFNHLISNKKITTAFLGVGTTGSGRKFIGKIIRADLIVDEITAHARAAFRLNPQTDTIIEIGGQDSKFTLMKEGRVTFSQMNNVCAAGTGSFIEEQANKLGCLLSDYSQRASGVNSPMASDRCTVFMERDINQLLNKGYTVNEILATALHSVMENYLKKVAVEASIGEHICFQGATAKNKSLVAAFEQRLKKKIFVSKYCHLTGALGVALLLSEEKKGVTTFRGLHLCHETIPVQNETCQLCSNHCHLSIASVQGEKEAYGFLCGRDYDTQKYVANNRSGFNLLEERKKIFSIEPDISQNSLLDFTDLKANTFLNNYFNHNKEGKNQHANDVKSSSGELAVSKRRIIIGIPAALHLFEELPLWKRFFHNLSIRTITSENFLDPEKSGKRIAGAEFCAPIDAMYGHAVYLADKADYLFLPVFLEARDKDKNADRNYCYYTQFSASLVYTLDKKGIQKKCLSPVIDFSRGNLIVSQQLWQCLKKVIKTGISFIEVSRAYDEALACYRNQKKQLVNLYETEFKPDENVSVALMGRPYVLLSKSLNKRIPDIFSSMGIKCFFQDMIPHEPEISEEMEQLLQKVPWYFAAQILDTAKIVATTKNLYPVLVTAFKCAPDSMIIEYFKKILNSFHKPYLILQIDDHDSNTGYETRIEAAVRAFRNHASRPKTIPSIMENGIFPHIERGVNGKKLLFPCWDPIVAPLLVANLKRLDVDACLLESSDRIIKKSMVNNTGQCLPLNIIVQEFIEYVNTHGLKPEETALWMLRSKLTCNLQLYPYYMKSMLENYGHGFEKASVYFGENTYLEFSYSACFYGYFAYMLGGLIRRIGCKIRPYELVPGETDAAIKTSIGILEELFLGRTSMDETVEAAISLFDKIPRKTTKRPKVAIFGDFYVRDNDVMNQDLIHFIENAGGEVISTPYNDYVKITIENILRRAVARGDYLKTGLYSGIIAILKLLEDKYYKYFKNILGPPPVIQPHKLEKHLADFNIKNLHSGESYDNILKIFYIIENYPDVSLFVQTNPSFCCPSLVTEAMTREITRITGIPVVTLTYDGTSEMKNDILIPYLQKKS